MTRDQSVAVESQTGSLLFSFREIQPGREVLLSRSLHGRFDLALVTYSLFILAAEVHNRCEFALVRFAGFAPTERTL